MKKMTDSAKKKNPFTITKAVDFTDEQILDFWVDMNFRDLIEPTSRKPKIIRGGKGSGKTHLLRFFSYNVQKIRAKTNLFDSIKQDMYLGIYLLCSGLNSNRFSGKGITTEKWEAIFNYYFELEVAELFLKYVSEILLPQACEGQIDQKEEIQVVAKILSYFSLPPTCESVADVIKFIADERRRVDIAVNNCIFTGRLDHHILVTRGQLIFGLPAIFEQYFHGAQNDFNFVYIIDEFENLTETQQKFIHTLYREKQGACTFRIGVRLYGIKTMATYADGQENVDGAEYEEICLDDKIRGDEKAYKKFASELLLKRLEAAGFQFNHKSEDDNNRLEYMFGTLSSVQLSSDEKKKIKEKYSGQGRLNPWMDKLKSKLQLGLDCKCATGIESVNDLEKIIELLTCEEDYYVEKLNCFFLYKDWAKGENLLEAAQKIKSEIDRSSKYSDCHFKSDMIAQIRRETETKQIYVGFDTFLTMTSGFPRYLLVLMKKIYDWGVFLGESPFESESISLESQKKGVLETVKFFYTDATSLGQGAERVKQAIDRIGDLFRAIRFSDKPSECALSTFSIDSSNSIVDKAANFSLLIRKSPRRGKNVNIEEKFQINPMIAPRWDLPTASRGTFKCSTGDLEIIFGEPNNESDEMSELKKLRKRIVDTMTAPSFGKTGKRITNNVSTLFSEGDHD